MNFIEGQMQGRNNNCHKFERSLSPLVQHRWSYSHHRLCTQIVIAGTVCGYHGWLVQHLCTTEEVFIAL
jgi:hypothetical protein